MPTDVTANGTGGTGSVACPCGGPGRYVTARQLAGHLALEHGVTHRVKAWSLAQRVLEGEPIMPAAITALADAIPPSPRQEVQMPQDTPLVTNGTRCGYCKHADGHTAKCPRRPGAKRATKASAKPSTKSSNGLPTLATPAAATALLRVRLTEELADARAEVRVLERLLTSLGQ